MIKSERLFFPPNTLQFLHFLKITEIEISLGTLSALLLKSLKDLISFYGPPCQLNSRHTDLFAVPRNKQVGSQLRSFALALPSAWNSISPPFPLDILTVQSVFPLRPLRNCHLPNEAYLDLFLHCLFIYLASFFSMVWIIILYSVCFTYLAHLVSVFYNRM